jgi:colicin import membrane protein
MKAAMKAYHAAWSITIILIAGGAHSVWAQAPKSPQISETPSWTELEQRKKERERIAGERSKANNLYAEQERECYQQFAVNDCLRDARGRLTDRLSDLKRQEVALNDVERRERAASKLRSIEEQRSLQRMQREADRREQALQDSQRRAERAAQKQAQSASAPAATSPSAPSTAATSAPQAPRKPGVSAQQRAADQAAEKLSRDQAAQARKIKAEQQQKKAAERKAKVEAQLKASGSGASSGTTARPLPIPPEIK